MKKMIYTVLLKVGIYILEYALGKVNSSKSTVMKEDIQINKTTAKAFSKFIKKHTVDTDEVIKKEESND